MDIPKSAGDGGAGFRVRLQGRQDRGLHGEPFSGQNQVDRWLVLQLAGQLGKQLYAPARFPNSTHGGTEIVGALSLLKHGKGLVPEIHHLSQEGVRIGGLTGSLSLQEGGRQVIVMMPDQGRLRDAVLVRYGPKGPALD